MHHSNKKIRILAGLFYPSVGGPQFNNYQLYSRLSKLGWEVQVSTHKKALEEKKSLRPVENIGKLQIYRFGKLSYGYLPYILKLGYLQPGIIVLHDWISAPNVFVCINVLLLKLFGLKKFKLIFTLHGFYNMRRLNPRSLKDRIENFVELKFAIPVLNFIADAVRVVVENDARLLRAHGLSRPPIYAVGNGLEAIAWEDEVETKVSDDFKKKVSELGSYYIQLGRIDRIKNIEAGVRALTDLPTNIRFVVTSPLDAADEDYLTFLKKLILDLDLETRVVFFGPVFSHEKYYILKKAITVIQPSYAEAFGTVVLEGMSQGLIPIIAKNTGLSELVEDGQNGFHINSDKPQELADKIHFIYTNAKSEDVQHISERSKQVSKKYTWEAVVGKIDELYSKTLSAPNR